jgi:hypothetical protein
MDDMIRYGHRIGLVTTPLLLALAVGSACIGENDVTGGNDDDPLATFGTVVVAATTTGSNQDPDGYVASLDEGLVQPLEVNGSVTFSAVRTGSHAVHLDGVAFNCTTTPTSPVYVTLSAGSTVTTTYAVTCS